MFQDGVQMIDLTFGFNFSFKRDKSKDKIVDLLLKPKIKELEDASLPNTDNKLDNTQPK